MGTINSALCSILSSHEGLSELISDRISAPGDVPENPDTPYITYFMVDLLETQTFGSSAGVARCRFQFDAWADDLNTALAVALQIRVALRNYSGTSDGVKINCCLFDLMQQMEYDPEAGLHRYEIEFIVEYVI
jgi:hypothetical protein